MRLWGWLILLSLLSSSAWCEWYSDTQIIMGTRVSASLWHERPRVAHSALAAVMAEMRRLDQAFSPQKPDSELSQLNLQAATQAVFVSAEMMELLQRSLYFSRLSGGAFDISFASLGQHYDYPRARQPGAELRGALLPAIDYRMIELNPQAQSVAFKQPQLRIDLGGIAKGYAVDRAIELLRERGMVQASVSAGGDSRVLGDRRGRPWMVGVKNPRATETFSVKLPLRNMAISTSGDYERFFMDPVSGERIHHILNPRTGTSASELMSVSVIGPHAFNTDPLATTVFVLGLKKGMALLNQLPKYQGVVIDKSGQVFYSDGLRKPRLQ